MNKNHSLDNTLLSSSFTYNNSLEPPTFMNINQPPDKVEEDEEEFILSSSMSSSLSKPMDIPTYNPMKNNKKRHSQYSMKSLPALISEDDEQDNSFTETLLSNGYYFYSSTSLPDDFQVGSIPKKLPSAWPIELVKELTTPSIDHDDDDKRFSFSDSHSSSSSTSPPSADHQAEPTLFDMDD
ncbi:unnamed protein product [Cunninghamella blakesleeana]